MTDSFRLFLRGRILTSRRLETGVQNSRLTTVWQMIAVGSFIDQFVFVPSGCPVAVRIPTNGHAFPATRLPAFSRVISPRLEAYSDFCVECGFAG